MADDPWAEFSPSGGAAAATPADDWAEFNPTPAPRPFLEKLGSFARNVVANPPPTIAGIRDIVTGAPAAATQLTWGADPEAAREAAGTMLGAAGLGLTSARALQFPARAAPTGAPAAPLPTATPGAAGAIEAAGRIGVEVPKYLATEATAVPQFAAGIRNVPWGGEPVVQSARRLTERLGEAKSDIAGGATTAESAGEQARQGLASWVKTKSQEPVSAAYKRVDELVNPDWGVPLVNTANEVQSIIRERVNARIPGGSKAADTVMQAIQGPMDYEGIKRLRTYVGERTPQDLAISGINPVENKRIYGALTKDLGNVVREGGGDQAFAAWQEANAIARLTKLQQQTLTKIIGTAGDAAPEQVFNRLVTMAGSKAGADLNRLQLAKRAMGQDAWDEIGSAFINRMGTTPEGTFSADRFVTAFGNMTPAARNELFSGQQHAALTDLFTVSKHVQERITRFANPSGTSRGVVSGLFGGHLLADPISALGGLVGTRMVAHALAQPAVVRAAADVGRAQLNRNPVATQRALERLYQVAARQGLISATTQGTATPAVAGPQSSAAEMSPVLAQQIERYVRSINGPQGYPDFRAYRFNPAGWQAFLANAPLSANVEDRR